MRNVVRREKMIDRRRRSLMSQNALAATLGKSQPWVSHIENGYVTPSPEEQKVICEMFNLPPDYFRNDENVSETASSAGSRQGKEG